MQASPVQHHPVYGPALPDQNWVPAPRYLLRRARVLHHVQHMAPCRVADIGCGAAALLSELARRGFEAYGIDRSPQALTLAQHLVDEGAPMELSPELRPEWAGKFNLVFSFEVIEHLEDDIGAMQDWSQYLAPGGKLILSTPAHPHRWNAADEWAGHVRRYTRAQLKEHMQAAGFIVEHVECYGFPLANIMEIWRARAYHKAMQNKEKQGKGADKLTDESGADRSFETRFWHIFSCWPSTLLMRTATLLQIPFLNRDLGNGYLVIARKA